MRLLGRVAGAGLLAATAAVHLDLYLTGYRTIPTIGWLFLLQIVAGFVLAAAVLALDRPEVAAAGGLFSLATLGGYLLSMRVGLFGFREVRTAAGVAAGVVEVLAFAVLGWLALSSPLLGKWRRPAISSPALAAVTLAAAALLGTAVTSATPAAPAGESARGHVELTTQTIDGVTVLADSKGFTLYLFVPDTPFASHCYGTCAAYWPPVLGTPVAGPGVTGRLGTVERTGGLVQATYDGHPLYTYVADTAPGHAAGNGINLNGGYWYAVTPSGKPAGHL